MLRRVIDRSLLTFAVAVLALSRVFPAAWAQTQQYIYDEAGNVVEIRRLAAGELALFQFAPAAGQVGSPVTIFGAGFNATLATNTVRFNGVVAILTSGSTSQLTAVVPPGATTGPISVSNGSATVVSARSFAVTAGPSIAGFSPTIGTVGTAVSITGSNFDPLPINDRVAFAGAAATVTSASPTTLLTSVPTGAGSGRITLVTPSGSTASAADFFVPPGSYTVGSVGFTGRLAVNGASLATTAPAGKLALVVFDGSAGSAVSLYLENLTYSGSSVGYSLYGPGNVLLASGTITTGQAWGVPPALPSTGTYTVLLNPGSGSFSASVRAEAAPLLTADGASASATLSTAGQPRRLAFNGSAGQLLGLGLTGVTLTPTSATYVTVDILRPNTTTWLTAYCYVNGDSCSANLTLAATGVFSLWIKPPAGATGSVQAWLSTDLTATLSAGTPYTLTTTRAGQNAQLSFAGTAGPAPAIEFTPVTTSPPNQSLAVAVYKPDGTLLTSTTIPAAGLTWTLPSLPVTGTYSLRVEPSPSAKGAATITSARITLESGTALAIDGGAATGTFATTGESARFTFDGTSGQKLGLGFTGLALTPTSATYASFTVYKPDGASLSTGYCYTNGDSCSANLTLNATGQHSIVVQPVSGATGNVQAWLSTDTTGTLTIGTSASVATTRAGQNATRSFTGTAGQLLRLSVSAQSTAPTGQAVTFVIYKPDGTALTSTHVSAAPYSLDLPALPTTGAYTLFAEARANTKGAATFSADVLVSLR